ncbi:hypothetical protein Acr_24g0005190 [Actinidia rufa]|uniref:Uncharacterized protein n=1 Tax=Actinidia rufa TaxID=165716 RepID=A0A7J0GU19_9ERIC|nr:hypothetical protein Acr_24g0005190 [Actinidia rufa]
MTFFDGEGLAVSRSIVSGLICYVCGPNLLCVLWICCVDCGSVVLGSPAIYRSASWTITCLALVLPSLAPLILNTSLLPSLYEAIAIIDGDERRHRLIQASPVISPRPIPIVDQIAFAASGSGPHSSGGTPTTFHAKTSHPTWVLDYGVNDHITSTLSFPGPFVAIIPANLDRLSRPIPLFDSPLVHVFPASVARASLKIYTRRTPPLAPLLDSSSVSEPSMVTAMEEEMYVLEQNGTWELVPLLLRAKLIGNASVYRLVGLIYLTNTRPDITFSMSVVSQFMHASSTSHLDAVHHILRYLTTCLDLGLFYTMKAQDEVSCFTDADYAGSRSDICSTSRLYTFYRRHLLSWKSSKLLLCLVLHLTQNIEPWLRAHVNSSGSAH